MNEIQERDFLRLVWGHRLFGATQVFLSDGKQVEVVQPGFMSDQKERVSDRSNGGADFHGAELKEVESEVSLYGGVRIDARASTWRESGQMSETGADSVMVHVVGERDRVLMRAGREVRTLVLRPRDELRGLYDRLLSDTAVEPVERECIRFFSEGIEPIEREQILARLMADRLHRKATEVSEIYRSLAEDWEETAYVCFLRSLGMGGKKRAYQALARSLPYRYVLKCAGDVQQIEALLLGQSGYLSLVGDAPDRYTRQLQDIYLTFKREYGLRRPVVSWGGKAPGPDVAGSWSSSVRPGALPPVMLAQAAHLLGREPKLFTRLMACADAMGTMAELREIFRPGTSDYWRDAFRAEAHADGKRSRSILLSDQKVDLRIINFVIPLLSARGAQTRSEHLRDWALGLYDQVAPEENTYTRQWSARGFEARSAFDSQALIQLATEYCMGSRCADCPVGVLRMVRLWAGLQGICPGKSK